VAAPGIRHDRITPGKPQQNGRQERFHRTLAELAQHPERDVRTQQRAFDRFRYEYNQERPHEALGLKPPHSAYAPSPRRYPRPLERFADDSHARFRVDRHGYIRWQRRRVFISTALVYEDVFVDPDPSPGQRWEVRWGPSGGHLLLGWIDERRPDRGLVLPSRRRR